MQLTVRVEYKSAVSHEAIHGAVSPRTVEYKSAMTQSTVQLTATVPLTMTSDTVQSAMRQSTVQFART